MHKLLVASLLCFALCSAQTAPSTCLTSLQALKPLAEEFFTHFTNDDFDFFPLAMQMANPQIQEVSEKCFGSSLPSLDSESCTLGLKDLVPVLAALKLDAQNMNFFQLAMNLDDNSEVIEGSSAACGLPVDFSLMTAQRCTDSLEILSPLVEVIVNSFYSADFDQLASSIADALEPIEEASAACSFESESHCADQAFSRSIQEPNLVKRDQLYSHYYQECLESEHAPRLTQSSLSPAEICFADLIALLNDENEDSTSGEYGFDVTYLAKVIQDTTAVVADCFNQDFDVDDLIDASSNQLSPQQQECFQQGIETAQELQDDGYGDGPSPNDIIDAIEDSLLNC